MDQRGWVVKFKKGKQKSQIPCCIYHYKDMHIHEKLACVKLVHLTYILGVPMGMHGSRYTGVLPDNLHSISFSLFIGS
jgi:hypothetical protein